MTSYHISSYIICIYVYGQRNSEQCLLTTALEDDMFILPALLLALNSGSWIGTYSTLQNGNGFWSTLEDQELGSFNLRPATVYHPPVWTFGWSISPRLSPLCAWPAWRGRQLTREWNSAALKASRDPRVLRIKRGLCSRTITVGQLLVLDKISSMSRNSPCVYLEQFWSDDSLR